MNVFKYFFSLAFSFTHSQHFVGKNIKLADVNKNTIDIMHDHKSFWTRLTIRYGTSETKNNCRETEIQYIFPIIHRMNFY